MVKFHQKSDYFYKNKFWKSTFHIHISDWSTLERLKEKKSLSCLLNNLHMFGFRGCVGDWTGPSSLWCYRTTCSWGWPSTPYFLIFTFSHWEIFKRKELRISICFGAECVLEIQVDCGEVRSIELVMLDTNIQ